MKKSLKSASRRSLTLGDLIVAVSSSSRSRRETVAALEDLFNSGRVCLSQRKARVRIV
jgi:hypothetical protein